MSPAQFAQVCRLARAVDDAAIQRTARECDAVRDRVLAHFGPDWARLYAIVAAHVGEAALPPCSTVQRDGDQLREVCTLPPLRSWGEAPR